MNVAGSSTVSRRVCEVMGVASFGFALIWLIALLTYEPADPAWFFNTGSGLPPANFIGRVGAFLAELSFQLLGYAAYLVPALLGVVGWHYFWCRTLDAVFTKLIGAVLLFACASSFLSLAFGNLAIAAGSFQPGGHFGRWLSSRLTESLNPTGSIIVILVLLFLAIILSTQFSFGRSFAAAARGVHATWARMTGSLREWRTERHRERQRREVIAKHTKRAAAAQETKTGEAAPASPPNPRPAAEPAARPAPLPRSSAGAGAEASSPAKPVLAPTIRRTPASASTPPAPEFEPVSRLAPRRTSFTLPPVALLDAPRTERKIDERELMESAHLLEEKCREFAAEGSVVQIHPGPIVTTFEFKPDAGVKYSKLTGLADDLSLALRAESVLIERIPGKSTVGIQIPNTAREQISLRDLLESDAYRRSASRLCLPLGKTIHGEPFIGDLAGMPHLLIAGSTGTGKSVAINAMLTGILYRSTPADVRMILIDPKRLELSAYEDIPHLLTPVVVDPKQAANALGWAVREMEERYKTLAAEGVRNIEQYNRNVREALEDRSSTKNGEDLKLLPYVIVVIDELADLMMVASSEVEDSIQRLAQMARAVGIHLIVATQRPSVDVITGLIKANFPARISFRVSSKVDSRTILDGNGAEQLLGKGDMLYLPPASSRLIRLHGPYISEQESARLAAFLRKQGKPSYDESITAEEKASDAIDFGKDDLYDEAARIVVSTGQASISYLQRRLRIGFSRAARLVDMMESEGLVSSSVAGKPREVLVAKDYFEEVDSQLR
jgi:DNA segregation ATPase FtsK/SpoIIIE, S-DNA-T family